MRRSARFVSSGGVAWSAGMLLAASSALAQQPPASGGGLIAQAVQEKLEAVKQHAAANKEALSKYAWTESIQVAVNGEVKTTREMSCRYGPDGKPQCSPLGPPPQQQQERGIRGRIAEKKKEEFQDYMQQVKGLIGLYVPPDSARMQAAHAAGNVTFSRPASGEAGLVFRNYSLPGDSMTLDFAMATHKMAALAVSSYLGDPSSPVTLNVQFAHAPRRHELSLDGSRQRRRQGDPAHREQLELPEDPELRRARTSLAPTVSRRSGGPCARPEDVESKP